MQSLTDLCLSALVDDVFKLGQIYLSRTGKRRRSRRLTAIEKAKKFILSRWVLMELRRWFSKHEELLPLLNLFSIPATCLAAFMHWEIKPLNGVRRSSDGAIVTTSTDSSSLPTILINDRQGRVKRKISRVKKIESPRLIAI